MGDLNTQLIEAVKNNRPLACVNLLLLGANINARSEEGLTPLHLAVLHGYAEVGSMLLDNGADACIQADGGETAFQVALQSHCPNGCQTPALAPGASKSSFPSKAPPHPDCTKAMRGWFVRERLASKCASSESLGKVAC